MQYFAHTKCQKCEEEYAGDSPTTCRHCGGRIKIDYDYQLMTEVISKKTLASRQPGVWKYAEFLPVRGAHRVTLGEGGTRLIKSERLAKALGMSNLFLKNETQNPTGTFKDRCSTVSMTKAVEARARAVVVASSGNAAASACAYSTVAGLPCYVFVPPEAGIGKLARIDVFGGRITKVLGPIEDSASVAEQVSRRHGWVNVTTTTKANPYAVEGTKTASYEISEALEWRSPDFFALPVGSGACLTGHWKGYRDFLKVGFIDTMPRFVAVQAEGCAPFASIIKAGLGPEALKPCNNPTTIASGITDIFPADVEGASQAIRETRGLAETVGDIEIVEAQTLLARKEGIFAEPTGAVSLAGVMKLLSSGGIDAGDVVVCEITGHGLNDVEPSMARWKEVPQIQPTLADFETVLESRHYT